MSRAGVIPAGLGTRARLQKTFDATLMNSEIYVEKKTNRMKFDVRSSELVLASSSSYMASLYPLSFINAKSYLHVRE